jgi:hypothetical protein
MSSRNDFKSGTTCPSPTFVTGDSDATAIPHIFFICERYCKHFFETISQNNLVHEKPYLPDWNFNNVELFQNSI